MSRSDLHEAAREYAKNGWPVFPLIERDKRPATRNGFKDATTWLPQVDKWWGANPNLNIGLPTGIAFDVLDLDGLVAIDTLQRFPGFPKGYRHPGPTSATGRGFHLLWQPTGRANGAALLGEDSKIDFRGDGGYIVAPPSIHPKGHAYTWLRPWQSPLPEPSDWLLAILDRRGVGQRSVDRREIVFKRPAVRPEVALINKYMPEQAPPQDQWALDRPDILEVAEELGLPLFPRNRYVETTCIYHDDHKPSLALFPDNRFYCWSCLAQGDSHDLRKRQKQK